MKALYEGEDRSVFLVGSFVDGDATNAIYEVKFKGERGVETRLHEPLATFSDGCFLQSASIFSRSNLYILLEDLYTRPSGSSPTNSTGGHIFDTKTWRLLPSTISRTSTLKPARCVVFAYEKLYYLASPMFRKPSFERYDPDREEGKGKGMEL
ncbi:uncharacterized protein Pyn_18786 [Prunus yedoensis var. nudiflora]|uniref:Uncharacterized protein n=1 Tax=Prunus yedoensis var. nudiflora TaxID=2094558 RepID=A0A315B0G5_PRUYE|nr:uncharacterized protein Pyn_18786 [Prunus yedoensis var. nudiflora]